jgi:hypothetical protein
MTEMHDTGPIAKANLDRKLKTVERADFIKRFFAVAVSVGFASRIARFDFLSAGQLPSSAETHQLLLLIFAMAVVVGSWEFYFPSIVNLPLADWQRFVLDIIIVSSYILLLSCSQHITAFFTCFTFIMLLYIVWDLLSIKMYPTHYGVPALTFRSIARLYAAGVASHEGRAGRAMLGPFITLWWFVVFGAISYSAITQGVWFYHSICVSGIAYIAYRVDQSVHWSLWWRLTCSVILLGILLFVAPLIS